MTTETTARETIPAMTEREHALFSLAVAGLANREQATADFLAVAGKHGGTMPVERARVAYELAKRGFDGIGRVQLVMEELRQHLEA